MGIAFVDIDGTLVRGTSCEKLFALFLLKKRKLGYRQALQYLWFAFKHFHQYGLPVFKRDKAYLAGLVVEDVGNISREFIDSQIMARLNPLILGEIERHKSDKNEVVLLSGTPEFLAGLLGEKLGIKNIIACKVPAHGDHYSGEDPEQHPYGQSKLELARQYCNHRGIGMESTTSYADNYSDLPLLEKAGRAVVVSPGRRLRGEALKRGWRIIE